MIKIKKILNNNAVIVSDEGEEKIAIGPGVAFKKAKNDIVNPHKIEKLFIMPENDKFQQLLSRIPVEHFTVSEDIISYAEKRLDTSFNEHIHIVLTDHISFAIEREMDGISLRNKLLNEIKILYRNEYEIGLWAIEHIAEKLNVQMPKDEAAFIALHIHTMKVKGGDLRKTVKQTTIVRDMIQSISRRLDVSIEEDDLSYQRLLTHLRFVMDRVNHYDHHTIDEDMLRMIQTKFTSAYACASDVAKEMEETYGIVLPESELGYITLHIQRLQDQHHQKGGNQQ
ncbi:MULTISPECIES: PRD domain-containing protein [Exiguobacterium]|uniref:PRD domain-containing protein n=1 Tax=Exiguobacterium TaxID=33986 RepID=UPI002034EC4B|nr:MULTISPECIES: PRD domain-containing protein [Exiguobacterium]